MDKSTVNIFKYTPPPQTGDGESKTDKKLSSLGIDNLPTPDPTPKEEVVRFLTTASFNEDFVVTVKGDAGEAAKFLHRMRVELSRMRGEVRREGKRPKPFKMILNHYHERDDGTTEIHLKMTGKSRVDIAIAVEQLAIGGGDE